MVCLLLLLLQDPAALVERLASDSIEERDEAVRKIKDLGLAAKPALEKAARSSDAEWAARAKELIAWVAFAEQFTPALRKAVPGIEDRLRGAEDFVWTELFLLLAEKPEYRELKREDREVLAAPALRGAHDVNRDRILHAVARWGHRSAVPEILPLIGVGSSQQAAAYAAGVLAGLRAEPALVSMLAAKGPLVGQIIESAGWIRSEAAYPTLLTFAKAGGTVDNHELSRPIVAALVAIDPRRTVNGLLPNAEPDYAVFAALARELACDRRPEALARAVEGLKDPAPRTRENSLLLLHLLNARESKEAILPLLRDPETAVRVRAADSAGALGFAEAGPVLLSWLEEKSPELRAAAIDSLGQLRCPESAKALVPLLSERGLTENTPYYLLRSLGRLGAREAADRIVGYLKDEKDTVRSAAAEALAALGANDQARELLPLLAHPEDWWTASEALKELPRPDLVPDLARLLETKEPSTLQGTLAVLAAWRAPAPLSAVERLFERSEEPKVVREAGRLLLRTGKPEHVARVLGLLKGQPEARPHVTEILEDADPALVGPEIAGLLRSKEAHLREGALIALRTLRMFERADEAVPLLRDANPRVRQDALSCVTELGYRKAVPSVVPLLSDEDPEVRKEAVWALRSFGAKEHAAGIRRFLADPAPLMRMRATSALGRLGSKEDIPRILAGLRDADYLVRCAATDALADLGAREAIPEILPLLRDDSTHTGVRMLAASALCRLGSKEGVPEIFRSGWRHVYLNALLQPRLWRQLRERILEQPLGDGRGPTWTFLAREIGLPIVIPESHAARRCSRRVAPGRSHWEALEEIFRDGQQSAIILDADRIRVIDGAESDGVWIRHWGTAR